ncbi:Anthranilate synthase component 2 [uncultured archaeon]|nr:Anthranilate synthase component 2 [uncultured archaeon]
MGDSGAGGQRVLLLDNYDSFVYNIFQSLGKLGAETIVKRNNEISLEDIRNGGFDKIVISPGPGSPERPEDFGVCEKVILELGNETPILGVCLGHQGIASAFGGKITRAAKPMHGKASSVEHDAKGIFAGIPVPLKAMRYHSLVVDESSLPDCLEVTARSLDDKAIMGIRHRELPIFGVQFHPESILTEGGEKIFENFLCVGQNPGTGRT